MIKRFISKKRRSNRPKVIFFFLVITISFAISLSYFSFLLQKEEVLDFLIKSTLFNEENISKDNEKNGFLDFLLKYTIGFNESNRNLKLEYNRRKKDIQSIFLEC